MGIKIGVVGLEFGREFVPIYRDHPDVTSVAIADTRATVVTDVAATFGIEHVHATLEDLLADPTIDAVHIVTGLQFRTEHVLAALAAGKHVACAVPMALSTDDIAAILDARDRAGVKYMMMETAVYTREYLYAESLMRAGDMGSISYARGTHIQDMTGWPDYWMGLPPMFYATHAISPILRLLDARASSVRAIGGATLTPENRGAYDNAFAVESAFVQLEGRDTVVELFRSLFQVARPGTESFSIFGSLQGFEWPQRDGVDLPLLHTMDEASGRGRPICTESIDPPDRADLLPETIRRYTARSVMPDDPTKSIGGGHGGSHPHLVHEFVSSIVGGRTPAVDHVRAANWTATGLAAHASAVAGGESITIPRF
jgi:predicted dehydrogenase